VRRAPGLALIPSEGSLDPTEVVDLGLQFAAEERSIDPSVREQIDPTPIPTGSDLDLESDIPTGRLEAACRMPSTACMNEVVLLAPANDAERCRIDRKADPKHAKRRGRQADVEARAGASLETGDGRLGGAKPTRKVRLCPSHCQSR
jgi:hypothetical protein